MLLISSWIHTVSCSRSFVKFIPRGVLLSAGYTPLKSYFRGAKIHIPRNDERSIANFATYDANIFNAIDLRDVIMIQCAYSFIECLQNFTHIEIHIYLINVNIVYRKQDSQTVLISYLFYQQTAIDHLLGQIERLVVYNDNLFGSFSRSLTLVP